MPEEKYKNPSVTVDIVIFTVTDNILKVLLIQRKNPPFQDCWAFPGGFVDYEEDIDLAAKRELEEETGVSGIELHQFHSFGKPDRDTRRRVITIAYFALVKYEDLKIQAADDAKDARLYEINNLPDLAFDHSEMLKCALFNMRNLIEHTPIAANLASEEFELNYIYNLYKILLGREFEMAKFKDELPKLGFINQIKPDKYSFKKSACYSSRF